MHDDDDTTWWHQQDLEAQQREQEEIERGNAELSKDCAEEFVVVACSGWRELTNHA